MSRLDLPDDQWVELADPRKVSERKRRAFLTAMSEFHKQRGDLDRQFGADIQKLLDDAFDLLIVALVSAWSFDVPVTVDSLLDLPTGSFDVLRDACMAMQPELLSSHEVSPDPKATTGE